MSVKLPIRVAIAGLTTNPGLYAWANNVHLPYLRQSSEFEIAAVLSTTIEKANAVIKTFDLPASTKAYDSPSAVAADPDIDLVSVVVKAPNHRYIVEPSILAGKNVFVEWPVDNSFAGTSKLNVIAEQQKVRSVVGLQARYVPLIKRIEANIPHIGRVLSMTVIGTVPTGGGGPEKNSIRYSLDADNGATMVDIHFAHFLESLTFLFGDIATVSSTLATQYPTVPLVSDDASNTVLDPSYPKSAPDRLFAHGALVNGAVYSLSIHGASQGTHPLSHGFRWLICGSTGEIEITGPALLLHINMPVPWRIRRSDSEGKILVDEEVLPEQGQPAVGRLYEAYARGRVNLPDFDHAAKIHRVVKAVWDSAEKGTTVRLDKELQV